MCRGDVKPFHSLFVLVRDKQCFVLILLLLLTFLFSEFFLFMNMMIYKSFRVVGSNLPGPGGGLESGSDTDQQQQQLALLADQDHGE